MGSEPTELDVPRLRAVLRAAADSPQFWHHGTQLRALADRLPALLSGIDQLQVDPSIPARPAPTILEACDHTKHFRDIRGCCGKCGTQLCNHCQKEGRKVTLPNAAWAETLCEDHERGKRSQRQSRP